jgi:hypothetical protein
MRLPPFENPYRKTRVSRGMQIWAGIKRANHSIGLSLPRRYVIFISAIGLVIFCLISSYLRQIIISLRWMIDRLVLIAAMAPGVVLGPMDPTKNFAVKPVDIRNLPYATAVLLGVLAAAATLPFTMIRVWINERNTQATEQGLITDRINTAVAGLGTEKTVKNRAGDGTVRKYTAPNLEVRVGAIYAPEHIAEDSDRDHTHIMAVLCACIRANTALGSKDRNVWDIFGKNYRFGDEFGPWITRPELHIFQYNQSDKALPRPCEPIFRPGSA